MHHPEVTEKDIKKRQGERFSLPLQVSYRVNCEMNFQAFSPLWGRYSCCWPLTLAKAVRQTPSSLS